MPRCRGSIAKILAFGAWHSKRTGLRRPLDMRDRRNPSGERQNPHGLKTMRSIGRQTRGGNFLSVSAISCPRLQVDASKEQSFEGSLIRMDLHRRRKPVSGQGFISFAQNGLNQLPGAGQQPGLPGTDASEAPIGECLVTLSYRLCATGGTFVPANRREPRG